MRDCVIVKWGGSLITDKESMCTADIEIIQSLAVVAKPTKAEAKIAKTTKPQ